jgi:HAD superfamily hydrolase (TIGR01509 family)
MVGFMLKAVLFDLDGTLANTDPIHLEIWRNLLLPFGYQVDEPLYQKAISGRLNANIVRDLLPELYPHREAEFSQHKEALFRQLAANQLRPTPGLMPLLDWLATEQIATAVVTNAPRDNALFMLKTLGLAERFPVVVIADDLPKAKPDPLPYQTALRLLQVAATEAVAFEDSTTGVKSAVGAGIFTIGVTSTHAAETLLAAGADLAVPDFNASALGDIYSLTIPSSPQS